MRRAVRDPLVGFVLAAALVSVAVAFGLLMARVDQRDDQREVCERLRSELIKHGVAVYGDQVPADVRRGWERMCG